MGHWKRGRRSRRDEIKTFNAVDRFLAASKGVEPQFQQALPATRQRKPQPSATDIDAVHRHQKPLEKDIQRTIIDALNLNPKVAFVGRFNRGQALAQDQFGNKRYTAFNTVKGFPDLHGMMVGGEAFYIEVKRPGNKPTSDQQDFLDTIKANGGMAGVAYSLEDALRIIEHDCGD